MPEELRCLGMIKALYGVGLASRVLAVKESGHWLNISTVERKSADGKNPLQHCHCRTPLLNWSFNFT